MTDLQDQEIAKKEQTRIRGLKIFSMLLFGLFVLILVAIYYAFVLSPKQTDLKSFKTGVLSRLIVDEANPIAPNDSFIDANGKEMSILDFKGSYVLVNVWATWCAPCVREMPALGELSEKYSQKGLKLVAINLDRADKTEFARKRLKELAGDSLHFYSDPRMRIAFPLKAKGLPVTIIYDKNSKEIARIDGAVEWQDPEAHRFIDAILAE